ncbi:MAG: molybdopterin-dependent oxidoreductase [Dehalococcoidia bacterium]|nr:molybdopterin-dependent oxidoreductase [Dehalococcoidia bacterium]
MSASPGTLTIFGEVAIGYPPPHDTYARVAYSKAQPTTDRGTWLVLDSNGRAVIYAGKVEYGQGIVWGFRLEVADELCVPISDVDIVLGDTDLTPWDMGTFGSRSTAEVGAYLCRAAATARGVLLELAADRLDLPAADLVCGDGSVASRSRRGRAVAYSELLTGQELVREVRKDAPLLATEGLTSTGGTTTTRSAAREHVTGAARYSQDILPPGVLFAAVLRPPAYGAILREVDLVAAERLPGVRSVVNEGELVAVLADDDHRADQGLAALRAGWDENLDQPSHLDVPQILLETRHEPFVTQARGSLSEGLASAQHVIEETYYVPYISNVPMEPRAATAAWENGRLTVWAGTQRPFGLRNELAELFGISEDAVRVIIPAIGGGFGSKSIYQPALEAARLARIAGQPVRVAFSRAEEMRLATFRPAALLELKSGFSSNGRIVAWEFNAYHSSERALIGRRGSATPYDIPNAHTTAWISDGPLASASYRSLGAAVNQFATESHIDEIAHLLGMDPLEVRLRNLADVRLRRVLEEAASRFGWESRAAGSGLAIGVDVGSYAATCVRLAVEDGKVELKQIAAAMDCGRMIDRDSVANQVEGATVMGIGNALFEAMEFAAGTLTTGSLESYRLPRIHDVPPIDVILTGDATDPSTGAGEPSIVPVAPAIANAVFAATGQRIRELPIERQIRT